MSESTDLVECEPAGKVLERYEANSLPALMAQHHPIHGIFGAAFEEMGGHANLVSWAKENQSEFYRIFSRMAPPPQSNVTIKKMEISVNEGLKRTVLDGELQE